MQKNDYNYSNAVFLPEAGFTNQILIRSEMVDILKADRLLEVRDLLTTSLISHENQGERG